MEPSGKNPETRTEERAGGGRQDKDGKRKFCEGCRENMEPSSSADKAFKNLNGSKERDNKIL